MKKQFLTILTFFLCFSGLTQTDWVTKNLGSGISIRFPNKPNYTTKDKTGTYITKTNNCVFMAIVQYNVIPNYSDFLNLPLSQQNHLIDILLDNTIQGIFKVSGNLGANFSKINIGDYNARATKIIGINPATGEDVIKSYKLVYAYNKTFVFQCLKLTNSDDADVESTSFLNSIKVSPYDSYKTISKNSIDTIFNLTKEEIRKNETGFEGKTDISGTDIGVGDTRAIPKEYEEMNDEEELHLSPFNLPSKIQLDEMLMKYERKKFLKRAIYVLAFSIVCYLIFKWWKQRKNKVESA